MSICRSSDDCKAVSVLIADSSPLFRSGIRQSIEGREGFDIVGEAETLEHLISLAQEKQPKVVILGLSGQNSEVWEAISTLADCSQVLAIIHMDGTRETLVHALEVFLAGAVGCIDRLATEEELTYVLNTVVSGRPAVSSAVAKALIEELLRLQGFGATMGELAAYEGSLLVLEAIPHRGNRKEELTTRELEVLELIAAGETNRAIAGQLSISEKTVKNHVSSILRKLEVTGRTEAAVWAVRRGFPTSVSPRNQAQSPSRNSP